MKTPRRKTWVILSVLVAVGLSFYLLHSPEPKYQGKNVSDWLDDWAAHKQTDYYGAIRAIGTNGLPYAVRNLARNDSLLHKKYVQYQPKLPKILRKIFPPPKPLLQHVDGANVFFYLGSNSIPSAIALLKHDSSTVRQSAASGLGGLRRQSAAANVAIPALIEALGDNDPHVRLYAALTFMDMGADASNAVPALKKVLATTGGSSPATSLFYLRAAAARALGKIGVSAAEALPELKLAIQEPDSYLRGQAAVAIWRISSNVDATLPILLQEMPRTIEDSKWDWIIALGEMGPRASQAIPQLKNELKNDQYPWVLEDVTNALNKIDPTVLPKTGIPIKTNQ